MRQVITISLNPNQPAELMLGQSIITQLFHWRWWVEPHHVVIDINELNTGMLSYFKEITRVYKLSPALGRGIDSRNRVWNWVAKIHRLAGRYDNPMSTWFLAPIAGFKLLTLYNNYLILNWILFNFQHKRSSDLPMTLTLLNRPKIIKIMQRILTNNKLPTTQKWVADMKNWHIKREV